MKRIIIILLLVASCAPQANMDEFAQCLTAQGAIMYGAYTCSSCLATMKLFGESFQYIDYVECHPQGPNPQLERCQQMQIRLTPTWIINDERYEGYKTLQDLAAYTGC